ncbi:MAG TPA: hypothetical protein VFU88_03350 [Ktedonobacterales bacterium]|nr:hypothetical protein [Ktedonobacterales bacterium]
MAGPQPQQPPSQQPNPSGPAPQQAYPPYPPGPSSQPTWGYPPPTYYAPAPPPQRSNRQLAIIGIAVALAVLVALSGVVFVLRPLVQTAVVSPAQELATPTSWVYGDNDLAVYISWTEQNGALSGTYAETYYFALAQPTTSLVHTDSDGFTGVHSGSKVTLTFNGSSQSMTGTLGVRTLTLARPDPSTGTIQPVTLHPGSEVDYNAAAAKVRQQHPGVQPTPSVGPTLYTSPLTGTVSDWPSGDGCSPQDNGFHITAYVGCYAPVRLPPDVTLSVQVKQISGATNLAYGISFRAEAANNHYFFGVDSKGKWLAGEVFNGDFQVLVDWTPNSAIHVGLNQVNTLTVKAKGTHFTFYVNSTQVGTMDDWRDVFGGWGLTGEDGIEVVFTNIAITKTP